MLRRTIFKLKYIKRNGENFATIPFPGGFACQRTRFSSCPSNAARPNPRVTLSRQRNFLNAPVFHKRSTVFRGTGPKNKKGHFMRKGYFFAFLLLALMVFAMPAAAQVSVGIAIHIGPPTLPVYAQPIAPGPGYIWTPGYWAYGPDGYYWVPGTWIMAPVGMLWTPGYWGWGGGGYLWHTGYWGPHVGFYGGINYGFGYGGVGFVGGRWDRGAFMYNTAFSHVDVTVVHNTYVDRTVVVNNVNRVSFNGGEGGIHAEPTSEERIAMSEHHTAPMAAQTQHEHAASMNRSFLASENHGHPAIGATARPGNFSGPGVTPSRGPNNSFHPPAQNGNAAHAGNTNGHPPSNGSHAEVHADKAPHNNPHPEPKNEKEHGDGQR
jgi:hypothetical protein